MTADAPLAAPYFGHSQDFAYDISGPQKLAEVEHQLGIRNILASLESHGWTSYNWRNSAEGKKSFVELSGMAYTDFLRTNSTTGVKVALELVLARVQKINRCEQVSGHDVAGRPGYDNGVLACRNCGFGGYSSSYLELARERDSWKMRAEQLHGELALIAHHTGVGIGGGGQVLLPKVKVVGSVQHEGYISVADTDEVLFVLKRETEGEKQ